MTILPFLGASTGAGQWTMSQNGGLLDHFCSAKHLVNDVPLILWPREHSKYTAVLNCVAVTFPTMLRPGVSEMDGHFLMLQRGDVLDQALLAPQSNVEVPTRSYPVTHEYWTDFLYVQTAPVIIELLTAGGGPHDAAVGEQKSAAKNTHVVLGLFICTVEIYPNTKHQEYIVHVGYLAGHKQSQWKLEEVNWKAFANRSAKIATKVSNCDFHTRASSFFHCSVVDWKPRFAQSILHQAVQQNLFIN